MKTTQITLSLFTILMLSACGPDNETSNIDSENANGASFVASDNNQSDTGTEDSASNSNDTNETGNTTVPNSANNTPNNGTENREEIDKNTITWDVSSVSELRVALGESVANGANDIIKLSAGTYKISADGKGTLLFHDNEEFNLTIIAADGLTADDVKLDGEEKGQILDYKNTKSSTLQLKNLSIINGKSVNNGGAISSTQNMTVKNCNVSNNSITQHIRYGGALYTKSKMIIENSKFFNNSNSWYGGAFSSDEAIIDDSLFYENSSNAGGAFSSRKIDIANSTFHDNTASGGGAFIGGEVVISDSLFYENNAIEGSGGAFEASVVSINNSTFRNNFSRSRGGAFIATGGTITNSIFLNNNSKQQIGGAFTITYSRAYISNNIFKNNKSSISGQGVFINNIFENNTHDILVYKDSKIYNNYIDTSKIDYQRTITITKNNIEPSGQNIFVSDNNLSLSVSSPVIDKGLNPNSNQYRELVDLFPQYQKMKNLLKTDKLGNKRIYNGTIDMGAIEFGSSK